MPGMGHSNVSLTNAIVESLFHHSVYVTSVYWIIGLALVLLLSATVLGPTQSVQRLEGRLG